MFSNVALIILDGWGIREKTEGNAVLQAKTPNYDLWLRNYERSILDASGEAVGLVDGQMGNSEVGHLNLGAGYVVFQDIRLIDKAIEDGSFFVNINEVLNSSLRDLTTGRKKMHLVGLLGSGGVHSHMRHLFALLKWTNKNGISPVLHIITDGRDTPPKSAIVFLAELERYLETSAAKISTVCGRYYAMDRDNRWERTELAYQAIAYRQGGIAPSAQQAISQSYEAGITDEFIKPTVIGNDVNAITEGDVVLFYNFRADRMRQIVSAFYGRAPDGFNQGKIVKNVDLITFTEYSSELKTRVLFPTLEVKNPLAKVISENGLSQFHAAETEKYAHVTYFFNGGREKEFDREDRLLVPSPKVATYDHQPEMSAYELTSKVIARINSHHDNFMVVNYANPDMVGHTGDLRAATKAVEVVDECAGKLVEEITKKNGIALVTADHGNAEVMVDLITGEPHTYHTTNPVSFFVIGKTYFELYPRGKLADVAPTVIDLLGLQKPIEMTGKSLIKAS